MVNANDSYQAWLEALPRYQRSLLGMMGDYEYHTQAEMMEATSHRFSAVVKALRDRGFEIESRPTGGTAWEYKLISCPALELEDED